MRSVSLTCGRLEGFDLRLPKIQCRRTTWFLLYPFDWRCKRFGLQAANASKRKAANKHSPIHTYLRRRQSTTPRREETALDPHCWRGRRFQSHGLSPPKSRDNRSSRRYTLSSGSRPADATVESLQPTRLLTAALTLCPIEHVDAPFFSNNRSDSIESCSINRDRHKFPFLNDLCGGIVQRAICSIPGDLVTQCCPLNFSREGKKT